MLHLLYFAQSNNLQCLVKQWEEILHHGWANTTKCTEPGRNQVKSPAFQGPAQQESYQSHENDEQHIPCTANVIGDFALAVVRQETLISLFKSSIKFLHIQNTHWITVLKGHRSSALPSSVFLGDSSCYNGSSNVCHSLGFLFKRCNIYASYNYHQKSKPKIQELCRQRRKTGFSEVRKYKHTKIWPILVSLLSAESIH